MKEFGSDFHYIHPTGGSGKTIYDFLLSANYYADGRQAIIHLYKSQGWKRLWMPEYFCYDVIDSLTRAGLDLRFYVDHPGYSGDSKTLELIHKNGHLHPLDAILRVNYFGTRGYRSSEKLPVAAVVEDHTHDLIGEWALNSHADWCVASLRKSLPIPEGGILWSPMGLRLPNAPEVSKMNEHIAATRWKAMKLKAGYLAGDAVEKSLFRAGFLDTEPFFDTAVVCSLDKASRNYLKSFNIHSWYRKKRENWEILCKIKKEGVKILRAENYGCYPFSLIFVFDDFTERERVRQELIEKQVYPAVLWNLPESMDGDVFRMSRGVLSIHCDGRYSQDDILQLKSIIESVL